MKTQIYILILILASCGTRKVERSETSINHDIETTTETSTYTITSSIQDILNLKPIDTTKPSTLEVEQITPTIKRYTIKNATFSKENKQEDTQEVKKEKTSKNEAISVTTKDKTTDRKTSTIWSWWWLLLLIAILLYMLKKR